MSVLFFHYQIKQIWKIQSAAGVLAERDLSRGRRTPNGRRLQKYSKKNYSCLSAIIGSTRVARKAGTKQAPRATPDKSTGIPMNVRGSVALVPNNKLVISRVAANEPANPTTT